MRKFGRARTALVLVGALGLGLVHGGAAVAHRGDGLDIIENEVAPPPATTPGTVPGASGSGHALIYQKYKIDIQLLGAKNYGEDGALEVYAENAWIHRGEGPIDYDYSISRPDHLNLWKGSRNRWDNTVKTSYYTWPRWEGKPMDTPLLRMRIWEGDLMNGDDYLGMIQTRIPSDGEWHYHRTQFGEYTQGAPEADWASFQIRVTPV